MERLQALKIKLDMMKQLQAGVLSEVDALVPSILNMAFKGGL